MDFSVLLTKTNAGDFQRAVAQLVEQGSPRLEKYLNIQDCIEKSLKIKFALKST